MLEVARKIVEESKVNTVEIVSALTEARNDSDSDLDLAWKMLEVARKIVEESEVNTVETFRIVCALTEVSMEKSKR